MPTKVPASGPERARILIVGEAPGEQEEREGRPFVGPAGQLLRNFLQEVGINPSEVFYTNICKYRPPANKLEKFFLDGGIPNERVIEGLQELEDEIILVRPNVIVACGNFSLWALTGKARWVDYFKDGERVRGYTGITDWRGSMLESTLLAGMCPSTKVIPTFHPSYIQREGMKDHGTFKCDLARVKKESEFPEIRRPEKEIIVVDEQPRRLLNYWPVMLEGEAPLWEPTSSRLEIQEYFSQGDLFHDERVTTIDIEYIGSKLLCVGMTQAPTEAFVFPTNTLSDLSYVSSIIQQRLAFNAQNSMFDASILEWHYQLPIMDRVVFDTMLAANAAQIELPKALDYLVSIYTDQPYYKGMVDWKKIKAGKQDFDTLYVYNGADVWTQHEVMLRQIEHELSEEAVRKTFDFMMRLLVPLWEMSKRGVRIDLGLMSSVAKELDGEAAGKEFELMFLAQRMEPINVKSTDQVGDLLFRQLGMKPLKMNKTGPACDDKTLAALQLKGDEVQRRAIELIRQIRQARDLKSKFFNIEFDSDGRMRGHYDPTKTVTGRLASRKFYPTGLGTNQQNISRDKRARRAFIADPKKVFCYADLEKAESLVVAHLTGDARMLFDHQSGQNAHRNLGADLFSKAPEELSDDEYYLAKKTRHAGNYMQGWMTFQRNVNQDAHKTGVSIDAREAKFFIGRYKELHPGLPKWWRLTEQELYRSRTLYNLLGRRRVFYGHIGGTLPEAVAFVPQSTVGDTLNAGLLNLEGIQCPYTVESGLWESHYAPIGEELKDCGYEALMQIHDAVVFQVFEKDLDKVLPLVRRALLVPLRNPRTYEDFTIPVEINADVDPEHLKVWKSCWGDCKPVSLVEGIGKREVVLEEAKVKKIKVYTGV